ncbi:hypothetical protein LR69_03861 [Geobacillus sp. BCO2]|nr:hypothetical protein LR69_03861 [Geobacillus sp. BCO2]
MFLQMAALPRSLDGCTGADVECVSKTYGEGAGAFLVFIILNREAPTSTRERKWGMNRDWPSLFLLLPQNRRCKEPWDERGWLGGQLPWGRCSQQSPTSKLKRRWKSVQC